MPNPEILQAELNKKPLYALVDAARVADMPNKLFELEADPIHISLFFNTPQAPLTDVAPYLIKLGNTPFLNWMLQKGWGKSWGVFLTSDADFDTLYKHLQSLLKVEDENGEELYFRYYDPRVLRVFLAASNIGEASQFLGPVNSFIMEDEQAENLLHFSIIDNTFENRVIPI